MAIGGGFTKGPSSKDRSRSQAGTTFPASYLAAMNQALGPQQNPLSLIGGNIGQRKGGLFASAPQTPGYGQTGMFNFGLNMAVTSPEYIRRNFPDQTQVGSFNPYKPLSFDKSAVTPNVPGPNDPYDPNNPRWREWHGARPGDWDLDETLLGLYGTSGPISGRSWVPADPTQPSDTAGYWVDDKDNDNPHLIHWAEPGKADRYFLYGSEISQQQLDYLNTGTPPTGDHPRVAPGTTYLMKNTEGWGMPQSLWDYYQRGETVGKSYVNGEWIMAGKGHGDTTPDLVYWGPDDRYYFRGWKMNRGQADRLQDRSEEFFTSAYEAEAEGEQNLPGVTNQQGSQQNTIYCMFGPDYCLDANEERLTPAEVADREASGANVVRDVTVAGGATFPETGGGTSPFAANRIPIEEYYIDPSFITQAISKYDPDKAGDYFRMFFGKKGKGGGLFDQLGKGPDNITLGDLWEVYRNADRYDFSGRSKGDLFFVIGDIHGQKLLEEQTGPEGIFGSQDPADQFIDPAPGTMFSDRVPAWVKDAYRTGTARGWSWDGSKWIEGTTDPEVVWDSKYQIDEEGNVIVDPVSGEKVKTQHPVHTLDAEGNATVVYREGTGRVFYRGQEISQQQWENMQQFGPLSGLRQTSENISTSFLDGTATGFSWKNGQWQPDEGRPDLVHDAENDTYYFRGQLITPNQYLAIVREGPQVMGTAATAQHLLSQISSGIGPEGKISQEDLDKFQSWAKINNISLEDLPEIRDQIIDPAQSDAALIADSPNFRFDPSLIDRDFGFDAAQIGPSQFNFDAASYEAPLITDTNQFLQPSIYQALTAAPTEEFQRNRELRTRQHENRLAAAGLLDSAAGQGQLLRGLEPLERQQQAMLFGAAGKATQLSKDYALQIEMANQKAREAAQAQAAGFRQEAAKFGAQTEYEVAASNQKFLQEARQFTGNAQVQTALADQKFANDAEKYGVEVAFNLAVTNQKALQEANLTNAGFTQEAALRSAANFLQGDITRFDNMARIAQATQDAQVRADVANMQSYANALGLNVQSLFKERDNYLQSLGLMQRDVQMASETERAFLALAFGEWQSQRNAIASAGRFNTSISRASSEGGFSTEVTIPIGGGGGGAPTP